jgi:hypothetical protein
MVTIDPFRMGRCCNVLYRSRQQFIPDGQNHRLSKELLMELKVRLKSAGIITGEEAEGENTTEPST